MNHTKALFSQYLSENPDKFLNPIYFEFENNYLESRETKHKIIKQSIPKFFKLLREAKGLTIAEIAKKMNAEEKLVIQFENSEIKDNCDIRNAYFETCGHQEFAYFNLAFSIFFQDYKASTVNIDAIKNKIMLKN